MDKHGIEMMILSLNAPAVQAIHDVKRAIEVAREANDVLAGEVRKRPDRFAAFAALPMQDPEAASAELTRCVKELGMVGALVNGFSQAGSPGQRALLRPAAIPAVLAHGRGARRAVLPAPAQSAAELDQFYEGHDWMLGPNWAFSAETAVHALRLIGSGLFDECPGLKSCSVISAKAFRCSSGASTAATAGCRRRTNIAAKHGVAHYFRKHFHVTTSGNFHTPSLNNAVTELGAERVMFSVDWPFEAVDEAAAWFDAAEIGEADARQDRPRQCGEAVQAEDLPNAPVATGWFVRPPTRRSTRSADWRRCPRRSAGRRCACPRARCRCISRTQFGRT